LVASQADAVVWDAVEHELAVVVVAAAAVVAAVVVAAAVVSPVVRLLTPLFAVVVVDTSAVVVESVVAEASDAALAVSRAARAIQNHISKVISSGCPVLTE
jgi:hypothetical protein